MSYRLVKFQKSETKGKKYDAIIEDTETKKTKRVPFGAIGYEQYKDTTGLGLYSKGNHLDRKRRQNYLKRHARTLSKKWSPSYFSARYLWSK